MGTQRFSVSYRSVETHRTITHRNRVRSACKAGKQQRIQHSKRVSTFYSLNIRKKDFSSKTVAFPYNSNSLLCNTIRHVTWMSHVTLNVLMKVKGKKKS